MVVDHEGGGNRNVYYYYLLLFLLRIIICKQMRHFKQKRNYGVEIFALCRKILESGKLSTFLT